MPKLSDRKFYIDLLNSEECIHCGKPKRPRHVFCYRDYKSLPDHMQKALWNRLGFGFEEAVDEALKYLGD